MSRKIREHWYHLQILSKILPEANRIEVITKMEGAKPEQITHSLSKEFLSYPWRKPEVITFIARDGSQCVCSSLSPRKPSTIQSCCYFCSRCCGYLQNAHKWSGSSSCSRLGSLQPLVYIKYSQYFDGRQYCLRPQLSDLLC